MLAIALFLAAAPAGPRPLLVTVDDLPMTGPARKLDLEARTKLHDGMLAALKKHGIRAVGLVTWRNVREPGDRALLERWLAEGHELGNHSHSHLDLTRTDVESFLADIEKGRASLAALLSKHGKSVRFFRFPFLREGDTVEKLEAGRAYLARSKQRNLPVTIDNQDWSFEDRYLAAADDAARAEIAAEYHHMMRTQVRLYERKGDALFGRTTPQILLLHAGAVGATEWDELFTWLEQTGHRFATADEVLADPAFDAPHAFVGIGGPALWDRLHDARERKRVTDAVLELIRTQADAWNRGDLDAFCAVYAPDALFVSPSGVTRGRDRVLARYRKRYPDQKAMGKLSFELLETRLGKGIEVGPFGDAVPGRVHQVTVAAKWKLSYPDKPEASGHTLIVFQPRGDSWEIVQDASM